MHIDFTQFIIQTPKLNKFALMISLSPIQPTTTSCSRTGILPNHQCRRLRRHVSSTPANHHQLRRLTLQAIDPSHNHNHNHNHHHEQSYLNNRYINHSNKLKIAIIGFGNFGQFLAKTLVRQGHTLYAHSRSNYHQLARSIGVEFFSDPNDLCEMHPDVILFSTSILSTESVLKSLPIQRLKRNTLFVDVLSVKEFPKNIFLQLLPSHFDVLCTHPMFGPESGKHSWRDLPFVFDKVRIGDEDSRQIRVENFLNIFKNEGCRMVEMSCAEHDKNAAGSQFITHTMGRILEKLELEDTLINTKGYETVLDLVDNTSSDSFDLYYGLFMYNKNAVEQLERLDLAFETLKKELFGHLHEVLRKQLFGKVEEGVELRPVLAKLPKNGTAFLPTQPETVVNNGTQLLPSQSETVVSNGTPVLPPQSKVNGTPLLPPQSKVNETPVLPPQSKVNRTPLLPPQSKVNGTPLLPPQSKINGTPLLPPQSKVNGTPLLPPQSKVNGTPILTPQ